MLSFSPKKANFILASTHHGLFILNRNDQIFYKNEEGKISGFGVGHDLLNHNVFNPMEINLGLFLLEASKKKNGENLIAIDCGANIGIHTVEWANFLTDFGKVISIEAQEKIYYALAGNIMLNNCLNVKAINAAAGDSVKKIKIPNPDYSENGSFGSFEISCNKERENIGQDIDLSKLYEIDQISIDSLNLERLDFLKIDVEGMEQEVLNGALETLSKFKPYLMIEFIKNDKEALKNKLILLGYQILEIGLNFICGPIGDEAILMLERQFNSNQNQEINA
jgi:hypothetical protein